MKIAIVAPSPVPFTIGGAENLCRGLLDQINQHTSHQAELIKLPSPEGGFWDLMDSYRAFAHLDLSHFDVLISTKYPAWMVAHDRHICYMLHRLRGLYDTYYLSGQPESYQGTDPRLNALRRFMRRHYGQRQALAGFFEKIDALRAAPRLPAGDLLLPGPFCRECIHFLDGIGLAAGAIHKFAAISHQVAARQDYFPPGCDVEVIYPPSHLSGFRRGRADYLFTASRLDSPKRVDLIIAAMGLVQADIPLKIAGSGPQAQKLKAMAAHDPRIVFLGFVNDAQLVELYSHALAVVYVPQREDYGLITVEAMRCAKPVITTTDAGGPNEFVEDGKTGFSVAPTAAALARAIESICRHPRQASEMGLAALKRVRAINWQRTVAALLAESAPAKATPAARRKKRICVAASFPVFPPRGGGQQRIYHLYRHLAALLDCQIELLTLDHAGESVLTCDIAPGVKEIRIPKSAAHEAAEREVCRKLGGIPVTDVLLPRFYHLTPEYMEALEGACTQADIVVASHPYLFPAICKVCDRPLIYEAHNVESELKKNTLPHSPDGLQLIDAARDVEQACIEKSQLITACAEHDAAMLQERYGAAPDKICVVPNGVDMESIRFIPPHERLRQKRRLGLQDCFITLFTGSWHAPNLAAVEVLLDMATQLPELFFLIMGSVGHPFQTRKIPPNIGLLGQSDDDVKNSVLKTVDVALNPMAAGSGTNLKMIEYGAAGIPILSTAHGARGLVFGTAEHIVLAELKAFPEQLLRMRANRRHLSAMIQRTRRCIARHYDWMVIAQNFLPALKRIL